MEPDSFTKQIIRNFLFATTEEMIQTTVLTAYSPTFSEGYDFSCALFAPDGDLVANAPFIPIHLGSMSLYVSIHILFLALADKPRIGKVL